MQKTLLLNGTYEVLSFISFKRTLKLIAKDKVEILSTWDDFICSADKKIKYPAILKLKKIIKKNVTTISFSRGAVVQRDKSLCQYCCKKLFLSEITIDHVIPKARGGSSSFTNCVVSCLPCNTKKGDKSLEEVGMKLINKPVHPSLSKDYQLYNIPNFWHSDWDLFVK